MPDNANELMEKLVALCKRRGFIFQSSEIYGGINGFWDYGPLGVELKRNIKDAWWEDNIRRRDDMVGLDCSIIMNPKVWEASGHIGGFNDPRVDCKECKARFRADKIYFLYVLAPDDYAKVLDAAKFIDRNPTASVSDATKATLSLSVEADTYEEVVAVGVQAIMTEAKEKNVGCLKKCEMVPNSGENSENLTVFGVRTKDDVLYMVLIVGAAGRMPMRGLRPCPRCRSESSLTEPHQFNLMLPTNIGAMEDSSSKAYLRPETAQGIFCNFKNVLDSTRLKLPFGIAQTGKSFRNEINPRNYTFRSREFEQMEIEFFCHPDQADKWYEYWRDTRYQWYITHGLKSSKLRLRNHEKDELAHYARACADIEYEFPFGISELEGVANRTNFDLTQHQKFSGKDLSYFDDDAWLKDQEKFTAAAFGGDAKAAKAAADKAKADLPYRFIPYVIEPSGGVDRATLAFLCEAYCEDEAPDDSGAMQKRVVMKFHPRFAPVKVAIFPLVKKEGMPEIAEKLHADCKKAGLTSFYDEKGAIGRRYRRQDEAGTPFCVTVDGQTLQDRTVTIRDRDTLKQDRIGLDQVVRSVKERIGG